MRCVKEPWSSLTFKCDGQKVTFFPTSDSPTLVYPSGLYASVSETNGQGRILRKRKQSISIPEKLPKEMKKTCLIWTWEFHRNIEKTRPLHLTCGSQTQGAGGHCCPYHLNKWPKANSRGQIPLYWHLVSILWWQHVWSTFWINWTKSGVWIYHLWNSEPQVKPDHCASNWADTICSTQFKKI